jgi:hypothetical protein
MRKAKHQPVNSALSIAPSVRLSYRGTEAREQRFWLKHFEGIWVQEGLGKNRVAQPTVSSAQST